MAARKKNNKLTLWIRRKKRAKTKAKANRTTGHIKTMDVILVVIAIALTAFTIEMITVFKEIGMVPDTLVACVFAALGGECGAMAWIKTTKERRQEREWKKQDEAEARRLVEKQTQKEEDHEP